eukprot:1846333-Pleurochrysis_carterae.AAC.1
MGHGNGSGASDGSFSDLDLFDHPKLPHNNDVSLHTHAAPTFDDVIQTLLYVVILWVAGKLAMGLKMPALVRASPRVLHGRGGVRYAVRARSEERLCMRAFMSMCMCTYVRGWIFACVCLRVREQARILRHMPTRSADLSSNAECLSVMIQAPYVGEVLVGMVMGPGLLNLIPHPSAVMLWGEVGLMLLVVEAGLDVDLQVTGMVGGGGQVVELGVCSLVGVGEGRLVGRLEKVGWWVSR